MQIGFIQDDLDLKLLVLYIMDRAAGPITFLQLFELALCDAGVDYFSLTQAVEHMVATGQLCKEEDRYAITDKGRRNSAACEGSLPYAVRLRAEQNLAVSNEQLKRQSLVRADVREREGGGYTLKLSLSDELDSLMDLELLITRRELALDIQKRFRNSPEEMYAKILAVLCGKEEK